MINSGALNNSAVSTSSAAAGGGGSAVPIMTTNHLTGQKQLVFAFNNNVSILPYHQPSPYHRNQIFQQFSADYICRDRRATAADRC